MRPGDTPVPIPNTKVKTRAADGTALETVWESRWLPDLQNSGECKPKAQHEAYFVSFYPAVRDRTSKYKK